MFHPPKVGGNYRKTHQPISYPEAESSKGSLRVSELYQSSQVEVCFQIPLKTDCCFFFLAAKPESKRQPRASLLHPFILFSSRFSQSKLSLHSLPVGPCEKFKETERQLPGSPNRFRKPSFTTVLPRPPLSHSPPDPSFTLPKTSPPQLLPQSLTFSTCWAACGLSQRTSFTKCQ